LAYFELNKTSNNDIKAIFIFLLLSLIAQAYYFSNDADIFRLLSIGSVAFFFFYAVTKLHTDEFYITALFIAASSIITGFAGRELKEIVLVPLFICFLIFKKNKLKPLPLLFILYSIFGMIAFFTNFEMPNYFEVSSDQSTGFQSRWWIISSLICFLIGYLFTENLDRKKFINFLFYFFLSVLSVSLAMYALNIEKIPFFNSFVWSNNIEFNRFGILSNSGLIVCIFIVSGFLKEKKIKYAIFLLGVLGTLFGGGRASFIALLVIVCIYFLVSDSISRFLKISVTAGLILFIISYKQLGIEKDLPNNIRRAMEFSDFETIYSAITSNYDTKNFNVFTTGDNLGDTYGSSFGRLTAWIIAMEGINKNPFFGNGIENSYNPGVGEDEYHFESLVYSGGLHNVFFSLAYTWGIPACILFLIMLISAIIYTFKGYLRDRSVFFGFLTFYLIASFVQGFMGDIHYDYFFMLIFGFVFSEKYYSTQKEVE
jgi:hypothetical protein